MPPLRAGWVVFIRSQVQTIANFRIGLSFGAPKIITLTWPADLLVSVGTGMYCPFCHDRAGDLFEPGGRRQFHTSGESGSDIYLNPDLSRTA